MQSTSDYLDITSALEVLSMSDIIKSLPPGTFKYTVKRSRALLHQAALALTPEQHQILITAAVSNSRKRKAPESRENMDTRPLAKHSDDTGLLVKEMDGYVPEDAGDDESRFCAVKL